MESTTEEKIEKLNELFPDADDEFLLEVLTSCSGSIRQAVSLIDASVSQKYDQLHSTKRLKAKTQSTLTKLLSDSLTKPGISHGPQKTRTPIALHTKDEVESTLAYCTYHKDILPSEVANKILELVMNDKSARSNEFYLFGNKCTSNHKTRIYSCAEHRKALTYNGRVVDDVGEYTDEMMVAHVLIEDFVNEVLQTRGTLPYQVKPGEWTSQMAVANVYKLDSNLQWHSDRLTNIGPQAIVASLSLGFSREFRVRNIYPSDSQVYSIKPEHNSLLIMHAGFQEEYKHCVPPVPKCSRVPKDEFHPISGTTRVNITYRNRIMKTTPSCTKCGYPMELRRTFKKPDNRGMYMWQCSKSYTEENDFKAGKECKGMRYANFNNDSVVTDDESNCSRWLADDDIQAREAQL